MAEQREHGQQQMGQHGGPVEGFKSMMADKGPRASQVVAVVSLLPVGGILLALSGMTLAGTVVGLALLTPLFVIFSPILVPAAIVIGLAVTGFLASGAFGVTALSSLSYIVNYMRGRRGAPGMPMEQMEHAKRRMAEAAGHVGQRAKDVGQTVAGRAHESAGGRS